MGFKHLLQGLRGNTQPPFSGGGTIYKGGLEIGGHPQLGRGWRYWENNTYNRERQRRGKIGGIKLQQ